MQSKNLIRALLLAGCLVIHPAHAGKQGEEMKLTMQTICLGRFLVDVPKEAKYIGGAFKYSWDSISVSRSVRREAWQESVAAQERRLRETKHESGESLLKAVFKGDDGSSVTFVYWKTPTTAFQYETESLKWMSGKEYVIKGSVDDDRVPIALEYAKRTLSELRPRRPDEIPAEPGFCIDDAYLAGEPSQPHDESARVRFGLKGHPDVWIYMYTDMNGDKFDGGLLARVNDGKPLPADLLEAAKGIRSLREGKHPVNGMHAEEILDAFPTDGGGYSHKFRWEARGKPRSVKEPLIVVELETATADGGMLLTNSSLTDQQAIKLFDAIVNSIRLRPTTPGKSGDAGGPNSPSPATPKRLPLKSKVTSAVNCPQTGIWECAPNTPSIAEHRRFIVAGQGMPYGLAQRPVKGLGRFIGMQEDDAVEITWTLVAYDKDAS